MAEDRALRLTDLRIPPGVRVVVSLGDLPPRPDKSASDDSGIERPVRVEFFREGQRQPETMDFAARVFDTPATFSILQSALDYFGREQAPTGPRLVT